MTLFCSCFKPDAKIMGPESARCSQHQPDSSPVLAHYLDHLLHMHL